MIKKCKLLFISALTMVFLFYRADSVVAMANEELGQNVESAVGSESEQSAEPIAGSAESEQSSESTGEAAESEQDFEPTVESTDTEPNAEPSAGSTDAEQSIEPIADSAESEQSTKTASAMNITSDSVSSGPALIEWMESHKDIGGTVKLTDHVVLDELKYMRLPELKEAHEQLANKDAEIANNKVELGPALCPMTCRNTSSRQLSCALSDRYTRNRKRSPHSYPPATVPALMPPLR